MYVIHLWKRKMHAIFICSKSIDSFMNLESLHLLVKCTTLCFSQRLVFHCNLCPLLQLVSSTTTHVFHCNLRLSFVFSITPSVLHLNLCLPLQLVSPMPHTSSTETFVFHFDLCLPLQLMSSVETCIFLYKENLENKLYKRLNLQMYDHKKISFQILNPTSLIGKESEGCIYVSKI